MSKAPSPLPAGRQACPLPPGERVKLFPSLGGEGMKGRVIYEALLMTSLVSAEKYN